MNRHKLSSLWFIAVSTLLSSCITSRPTVGGHSITGPDGSENEVINCAYIDQCYSFARDVCGGTYKIVNSNTDTTGTGGRYGTTSSSFILLVKCDSGKASYPVEAQPNSTTQTPPALGTTSQGEFPNAHSYKDCDQYMSLYRDRCRDEVYARAQKEAAPQSK